MSPTDAAMELLTLAERDCQAAMTLAHAEIPQTDAAVQFRYELAGEVFKDFEQFAQLTKELLACVRSLLTP